MYHINIIISNSHTIAQEQKTNILFADSEVKRAPQAWQLNHKKRLYFGYA
jgi:unsaturated rhamnogalacturonyl hydrolase